MRTIRRLALATALSVAGIAPASAVDLFDQSCEAAGRCAYNLPRGGRVFRPIERQQPAIGIEVPPPGAAPVTPRPRLQLRPSVRDHLRWCSNRYRSYRSSDDTYSPKAGIRRPCISPYG